MLSISKIFKPKKLDRQLAVYNNILISKSAILNNFDLLSNMSPSEGYVIPVLKSNAYGHGIKQVARILQARRFPYIAVDGYFERLEIAKVSKQPVLIMGAIRPENYSKVSTSRSAFVISDTPSLMAVGRTKKRFKVHIEIETGMGRHGLRLDELSKFINELKKYPKIYVEGIMTHLSDADNPKTDEYVIQQVNKFDQAVELFLESGIKPKYYHIAQSAGSTKAISRYANTIRPGIALYGISPLDNDDVYYKKLANLKPALTLTSTIAKTMNIDKGGSVSYNRTFRAKKNSRIGILPLGYYEGVPREFSNTAYVTAKDKKIKIVGRVCMNHTMIDITDTNLGIGDKIEIISNEKTSPISLDNICKRHGLFNYLVLVKLNENIRRTIID
ncbi:alanine racemase [Candidatus Saccharibacteria bacterium]|nr:alanine racemase [Candidatus Saccharibacteria bacterium]